VGVAVSCNKPVAFVEARIGDGPYVLLDRMADGSYAKALDVPAGAKVTFRATGTNGASATSIPYTWGTP